MPKLSKDAAYALLEEGFRAGFRAANNHFFPNAGLEPYSSTENLAWYAFEPSEEVKETIE